MRRTSRDGSIRRVSTVELRLDGTKVVVTEHRGDSNAQPPKDAVSFVDAYVRGFEDGTRVLVTEDLSPLPDAGSIGSEAGYAWDEPGAWETVRDLWAPFVPRGMRHLGAWSLCRLYETLVLTTEHHGPFWSERSLGAAAGVGGLPGAAPLR